MTVLSILAHLEAQRDELQRDLQAVSSVRLDNSYIVVSQSGLPLSFVTDGGVVKQPKVTRATLATRFTRNDAERVAAAVIDGNKQPAKAVHIREQLDFEIRHVCTTINTIRAMQNVK